MTRQQPRSATSRSSRSAASSIWHCASSSPLSSMPRCAPRRERSSLTSRPSRWWTPALRAAAKRLPPLRPRRTPARYCLSDGIAAPRVGADGPRSPAADVPDPPRRADGTRRQLTRSVKPCATITRCQRRRSDTDRARADGTLRTPSPGPRRGHLDRGSSSRTAAAIDRSCSGSCRVGVLGLCSGCRHCHRLVIWR